MPSWSPCSICCNSRPAVSNAWPQQETSLLRLRGHLWVLCHDMWLKNKIIWMKVLHAHWRKNTIKMQRIGIIISVFCSVESNSLWPHRLQPIRLLSPRNFPGKSTEGGGHFLLQGSSWLRDQTHISCICHIGTAPPGKPYSYFYWAISEAQTRILA